MAEQKIQGVPEGLSEEQLPSVQGVPAGLIEEALPQAPAPTVYAGPKAGMITPPTVQPPNYEMRPVLPSGERVGSMQAPATEQPGTVGEAQAQAQRETQHPILSAIGAANRKAGEMAQTGVNIGREEAAGMLKLPLSAGGSHIYQPVREQPSPETTGIAKGLGGMVGGVVADPRQWPLLFLGGETVGPVIQRAISGAFAANMAKDTVEGAKQLGANWDNLTPEERAEQITSLGLSDVLAGVAGAHSIGGEVTARGTYNKVRDVVNPVPETAEVKSLVKETAKAEKVYDAAKAEMDKYRHSVAQGVNPPENVLKAYDKASTQLATAKFHEEVARDAASKAAAERRAGNAPAVTPQPATKEPSKVQAPTEIPAEEITALGKKKTPMPQINVKTPGQVQPETFPQEPKPTPLTAYGRKELAGGQGTMGKPPLLTAGENPPIGSSALSDIIAATEEKQKPRISEIKIEPPKAPEVPKVGTAADLKSLKAKEGRVVDTSETLEGRTLKALQEALKPEEKAEYKGEERREKPRPALMSPVEIENAMKGRKPVSTPFDVTEGAMETIKRDQAMPKHPAEEPAKVEKPKEVLYRGTNAAESAKIEESGKITPDAFSSGHLTPDKATAEAYAKANGGKVYSVDAKHVPEKDLAHYRETGRGPITLSSEVPTVEHAGRPNIPAEEGGYAAKKEEVIPVGEEGRVPAKSAAEYHPAVEQKVSELSDEDLKKLAKAHGLNPDEYDLKVRDERRHRVERDQLAKDVAEQMGEDEKINIGRAAERAEREPGFENRDRSAKANAERAAKLFPRLRGPVDEFGNPKVGGGAPEPGELETREKEKEQTPLEAAVEHTENKGPQTNLEAAAEKTEKQTTLDRAVDKAMREIEDKLPVNPNKEGAGTEPKELAIMKDGKPEATVTVAERDGKLRLKGIESINPGTGAGSRALKVITDIADKHGVTMELTASPYGDENTRLNKDQLKEWYGRHGFVPEKGYEPGTPNEHLGYMVRPPQKQEEALAKTTPEETMGRTLVDKLREKSNIENQRPGVSVIGPPVSLGDWAGAMLRRFPDMDLQDLGKIWDKVKPGEDEEVQEAPAKLKGKVIEGQLVDQDDQRLRAAFASQKIDTDTGFAHQAQAKLGPNASLSDVMQEAAKMKGESLTPAKKQELVQIGEANKSAEPTVNPKPAIPRAPLDPAKIAGGEKATPHTNYHDASQVRNNNPWVRRSADPLNDSQPTNEKRTLLVQFSTNLINKDILADESQEYYDKLYSGAREGYDRMKDFWETPQWMGFASHIIPDADVYVVRDLDKAKEFLNTAKYGNVMFSALDVNKGFIKQLAEGYDGKFDVGGYIQPDELKALPNVTWHDSLKAMAEAKGFEYKNGVDYRHFQGSDVIPRLTLSDGCLHKCAFCIVPKEIKMTPADVTMQQAQEIGKMGSKLVYINDKTFGQAKNYETLVDLNNAIKKINPDFKGFVVQTTAAQMNKLTPEFLKASGIKYVELGIETYNDPILKELHKPATEKLIDKAVDKLRQTKTALIPNIIVGLPGETAETLAHTLDWLKANKDIISHLNIYNLALYKDAELGKAATTAAEDFDENVLNLSRYANPEMHQKFAGDLYKMGQELLSESKETAPQDTPKYIANAHNANQGFTFNPSEGLIRDKAVFSVAGEHPELDATFRGSQVKPSDVKAYVDRPDVKEALESDPRNSVGGWVYKGNSHLEVSKIFHDKAEAIEAGKKLNQNEIYDHAKRETVSTGGTAAEKLHLATMEDNKPEVTSKNAKLSDEELKAKGWTQEELDAGAHLPTVGGAKEKPLPTGDQLIKKYGESSGDPAHTTFILKDGRGVANTGTDHDIMLGGKATDKNPPREQFVSEGNIRVRPRSGGIGGREVSISIPESGVNVKQLAYIQKMAPQLSSGAVLIEIGKPGGKYKVIDHGKASAETLEDTLRSLGPILNDKGAPTDEFGNPTVSGGSPSAGAAPKQVSKMTVEDLQAKLPTLAQKHLTPEEKASITTTATGKPRTAGTEKFIQNMEKIPSVQEYIDIAQQGEGARKWYSRSTAAFDAMHEAAPDYFKEGDKKKFLES